MVGVVLKVKARYEDEVLKPLGKARFEGRSVQHQPVRELGDVDERVRTLLVAAPAAEVGGEITSFTYLTAGLIYL